ncbi:MAG: aminotransferase class III-fold pyridoxal phosphate-dependent enzyme [Methanomassiliicoccales archaeon]
MIQDADKKLERQLRLFRRKTGGSREAILRAKRFIPGGVNGDEFLFQPYPLVLDAAAGATITDVDGNTFTDFYTAAGSLILGHAHKRVIAAISETLETMGTTLTGAPNVLESRLASQITDIVPSAERVRFTSSGHDANLLAIRLCLAARRGEKVGKFEGHYHGSFSYGVVSARIPRGQWGPVSAPFPYPSSAEIKEHELYSTVVMPFNRLDETISIIKQKRRELACVILEAVAGGYRVATRDFLKGVREITEKYDIPLILDETTTGFRVALGGAEERFRVTPDLATFGKIIGGGLPAGALVGKREMMDLLSASRKESKSVMHSGIFNGNPLSMAAGLSTISQLSKEGTYAYLDKMAQMIRRQIEGLSMAYGVPVQPLGLSSIINPFFTRGKVLNYRDSFKQDLAARYLFDMCILNAGIYVQPGQPWYLCTALTKPDIHHALEVLESVFDYLSKPLKV